MAIISNSELQSLNQFAHAYTNKYMSLDVLGNKVHTPYYINKIQQFYTRIFKDLNIGQPVIDEINSKYKNRTIPYGWYRGKGTPEQLVEATLKIAELNDIHLNTLSAESIEDFMTLFGIGLDCSGYVYNTLQHAFENIGKPQTFIELFEWKSEKMTGPNYADCNIFAKSTYAVQENDVRPLDLILVKNKIIDDYVHLGLVLEVKSKLVFAESTLSIHPSGIHICELVVKEGKVIANNSDRFPSHMVEIRRLKSL